MDNEKLPTPEELGQVFLDDLQNEYDIQEYFEENSNEIIKRLNKEQIDIFISKYDEFYNSEEVDEFDLPSYFATSLYLAYCEQDKEPEVFLQDLVTNTFKI